MFYKAKVAVCSEIRTKHINAMWARRRIIKPGYPITFSNKNTRNQSMALYYVERKTVVQLLRIQACKRDFAWQ
jgi:hypothetical protein